MIKELTIPEKWTETKIDEISDSVSTSGKKIKTKDALPSGKYPVIDQGVAAVSGYSNDDSIVVKANLEDPIIIFGDHTRIVKYVKEDFVPGADGTKLIKAKNGIHSKYLKYLIQQADIPDRGYGRHFQFLKSAKLPLAPMLEQRRIADKLDTVLTRVDAVQDRLARITPLLKRFRQSILAAATSGRLTEEWRKKNAPKPKDQRISELLDCREKVWVGRGKYKTPYLPKDDERTEFIGIPDSWIRGSLDLVTKSIKDGPHFSPKYEENGIPFISARNIKPGRIDFSDAKYISKDLHLELSARCKPDLMDVLYTKGGTTGLAAVNENKIEFNVWVHVAVLKVVSLDLVNPYYLQHALNSPACYSQAQDYTHGVGNQDLGLTRMCKIILPLPCIEEQTEIVRLVELLMGYADRLEARLQAAQTAAERLTPALLAKAFRGELVPQDPSDEPAAELLRRLREARATEAPAKPKRGRKAGAAGQVAGA